MDDADLQIVLDRARDIAKDRLSDLRNYPFIGGRIAFFDEDVRLQYLKASVKGKPMRDMKHMSDSDMWDIRIYQSGDEIKWTVFNSKTVFGNRAWNLKDDILSVGTGRYEINNEDRKKRMSFFDRYRNRWNFHRVSRAGIGPHFVNAFNGMINRQIELAIVDAIMEYRQGRL